MPRDPSVLGHSCATIEIARFANGRLTTEAREGNPRASVLSLVEPACPHTHLWKAIQDAEPTGSGLAPFCQLTPV